MMAMEKHPDSIKNTTAWIILVIVKQHLVQIGRADGPIEYVSQIHAAISWLLPPLARLASTRVRAQGYLALGETPPP